MDAVMRERPKLAVFDCDGTLWDGDAGAEFFDWEIRRGVISRDLADRSQARYAEYKAGNVSEDEMCGEMVTLHAGLHQSDLLKLATIFFAENFRHRFFPEMVQLVKTLHESGCEIWAVSSTNEWVIRAAMKHVGIPEANILAACVEIENGAISGRLIRVPSGPGKRKAIREIIQRTTDAVFGNSRWDIDMLEIARHPYAINPNPDLEQIATERGWTIYQPAIPVQA